ncbi:glycoside hydrolase family 73 protein [Paenibacillus allorhizosphaerae]|uniref:Mannosyl-glycoprotein endo-beta-N-acetylglucosamidase-like domain-containing protein n=1 Tax=Paenibacillus allorhizosphaerae TaxID=2849866 RepID=A0ABN7TGD7_9BACL|nr:glycoside hydrolase family 73 protein [Paenibacillus allorhizosphaerae]CAG7623118.1 hypothetical protein PAECIP111802_00908 [Paenibacillus allorhizosphaerae]
MTPQEFITAIAPFAVSEQQRTGVLASVTMAQAALESGWGSAAPGNNLFGIKGTASDLATLEYVNGRFVTVHNGFRVYDSWEDSIADHSDFLLQNSRYAAAGFFERSQALDYTGAAYALQSAGYAADPQYAIKLISIIQTYQLAEYDTLEEDDMPMKFDHDWQWNMLGDALEGLYRKGLLSDYIWVEKAYNRQLTGTELAWLNTIIYARQSGIEV